MSQSQMQPGPAQQPMYPTMYPPQHGSTDYLKPLASDFLLAVGAIVGIFLMLLGSLIWGLTNQGSVYDLGKVLEAFGTFLVVAVLLMGAFVRSDADKVMRAGYVIAAALILGLVGFW